MADNPFSPRTVSLSRSLARETPRHLPSCRDRSETPAETTDLKALAFLVLARETQRDSNRDRVSRDTRATEARQSALVCRGVAEGETASETPAVWTASNAIENQIVTGVSLSRVLVGETPETPPQEPPLVAMLGMPSGAAEAVSQPTPRWGEVEEERAAIDHAALLWLLNGDKLIALTANTATIERQTGARQICSVVTATGRSRGSDRAVPSRAQRRPRRTGCRGTGPHRVEHDGKVPRAWAEGFARLHPDRPAGDLPAKRWLRFVDGPRRR